VTTDAQRTGPAATLAGWTVGLLLLAVATRTVRWAVAFPVWGDEAKFALNLVGRGFGDVFAPLRSDQVVPAGFLAFEVAAYEWLGPSERSLRLLPYLASIGSVFCFYGLSRIAAQRIRGLSPLSALIPLAIFAASYYPIRYGSEIKPYSVDLFLSSLLMWLGARVLVAPSVRAGNPRLVVLALLIFPVMWFSYPVVFVGAALAAVLLPGTRGSAGRAWALAVYVLSLSAGFLGAYLMVGVAQLAQARVAENLQIFWGDSFPPAEPGALILWLVTTHTGQLFAYPNGGKNGGSSATLLLFVVGAWTLWRGCALAERVRPASSDCARRYLLVFLLLPFALALQAAFLRLYPYGGHPRLSLYLGPVICLVAGLGAASLLSLIRSERARHIWTTGVLAACVAVGAGGIVRDVLYPYKDASGVSVRQVLRDAARSAGADGIVISLASPEQLMSYPGSGKRFRWYLHSLVGKRLRWGGGPSSFDDTDGHLVVVSFAMGDDRAAASRLRRWRARMPAQALLTSEREVCALPGCDERITILEYERRSGAGFGHQGGAHLGE
jgi:hypothetical protein